MKPLNQWTTNWTGSAGTAAANYSAGVNAYTGDWAGATVAQEATLLTNVTQAISNGSWRRGVTNKGTNGWKSATVSKESNFATGFSAGASRQSSAIAKILSAEGNIVPSLPARGTYEQNKVRATTLMDALHALKGTLGA